jgi:nucleotide-binding universal stress UspA family protein
VLGAPAPCLVAFCREIAPELVVIGAPRPKGETGLRSRMAMEVLARGLAAPMLVVPFPA